MSDTATQPEQPEMTYAEVMHRLVENAAPALGNDHATAVAAVDKEFGLNQPEAETVETEPEGQTQVPPPA